MRAAATAGSEKNGQDQGITKQEFLVPGQVIRLRI